MTMLCLEEVKAVVLMLFMAFPVGSPLVSHFSKAILNVTEATKMTIIEQKNFGPGYSSASYSISQDTLSLTAENFVVLFIFLGSATLLALFCSETPIGRKLNAMATFYGHWFCGLITFSGDGSRVCAVYHGDGTGESSSGGANESEQTNEIELAGTVEAVESPNGAADGSALPGEPSEVHQPEPRN